MGRVPRVIDSVLLPLNLVGLAVGIAALLFRQITNTLMSAPEYRASLAAALFAAVSFLYADHRRDSRSYVYVQSCTFLAGSTFALMAGRELYFRVPPTGVRDGIINAAFAVVIFGAFIAGGFHWLQWLRIRDIWRLLYESAPRMFEGSEEERARASHAQAERALEIAQHRPDDVQRVLKGWVTSSNIWLVVMGSRLAWEVGMPDADRVLRRVERRLATRRQKIREVRSLAERGESTQDLARAAVSLARKLLAESEAAEAGERG
jgi:hypothetical protein